MLDEVHVQGLLNAEALADPDARDHYASRAYALCPACRGFRSPVHLVAVGASDDHRRNVGKSGEGLPEFWVIRKKNALKNASVCHGMEWAGVVVAWLWSRRLRADVRGLHGD